MTKQKIYTEVHSQLGDMITPVSIYLKVREHYPISVLLESSDYQGKDNSFSFIGFDPIATFEPTSGGQDTILDDLIKFYDSFEVISKHPLAYQFNGIFGYLSFESVRHFETIKPAYQSSIPDIRFNLFKYVIAVDHFNSRIHIIENKTKADEQSNIDQIRKLIMQLNGTQFSFEAFEKESTLSDGEYMTYVAKAKEHCQRGDVFQLVLSRSYSQRFKGDEFNVYRALRSINPSPYLFYFDYGNYKLMGSSPEAQVVVKGARTEIHPIAGTVKRTGNAKVDEKAAEQLTKDPKENAEHAMLVDLSRNDLSKSCSNVTVEKGIHLQYFSHVIHLVSIVNGNKPKATSPFQILADSFPAGTLSGAPKYRALELIYTYEQQARGYYGGTIGYANFSGDLNMAIMIRSLMSQNNRLHYQAGAGIVIDSKEEDELKEVENKLRALNKAIELAQQL